MSVDQLQIIFVYNLKNRHRNVDIEKLHQLQPQLEKLPWQIILNNNRCASLAYLGPKAFHKYQYFVQKTGRLSSLASSIDLCCTFASSFHPMVRDADPSCLLFNLQQAICFKIFTYVVPAAFKQMHLCFNTFITNALISYACE